MKNFDYGERRLKEIAEIRSLLNEEEKALRQSLRAREKLQNKTTLGQLSGDISPKKKTRGAERRDEMLAAITQFIEKHGDSRSKEIQQFLEKRGILKEGAPGNQPTLSRFITAETAKKDGPIVKARNGVVSLRK